ncbi:hypothetical protein P7C70_g6482, partial [Phenoliferia sp. Uapishka_3]
MADSETTPLLAGPQQPTKEVHAFDLPASRKWQIMAGCQLAVTLGAIDTTIVATLISPIASSFHKSNQASWLGTSFLLANITFTPLFGRLCDILGRRAANGLAIALFTAGTALCAVAPGMKSLILARFIAGMGAGGMSTTSTVIIADLFPLKQRGLIAAISTATWATGSALGGPLGGWIADNWSWRAAFTFQVPLLLASLVSGIYSINYKVEDARNETIKEKLARVDFVGIGSLFVAVAGLLLSLSLHQNQLLPWSNTWVIVSTLLAVAFFIIFLSVEAFVAKEPVLPFRLLRCYTPFLVCVVTISCSMANFGVLYNLPIWFLVNGSSTIAAGAHLLPTSFGTVAGSMISGIVLARTGAYRGPNVVAGFSAFLGVVLLANLTSDSSEFAKWLDIDSDVQSSVVLPAKLLADAPTDTDSYMNNTSFVALMASVARADIPAATGLLWLFRTTGQIFGVAASAAILQGTLTQQLNRNIKGPDAAEIIKLIRQDSSVIPTLPSAIQVIAKATYGIALRNVFWLCAVFACMAWACASSIPQLALDVKVTPILADVSASDADDLP